MKVIIGDYEVEVKAKHKTLDTRCSKERTFDFLNEICLGYFYLKAHDSEAKYIEDGKECHKNVAEYCYRDASSLFKFLDDNGVYKH